MAADDALRCPSIRSGDPVGTARPREARGGRRASRAGASGAGLVVLVAFAALGVPGARAEDQSSAHFRHRAAHFAAIAAGPFDVVGGPLEARAAGLSLGAGHDFSPAGAPTTLRSLLPGYWPIQVGRSPSLDLDGDGAAYYVDADDDGDGLQDVHETGTGAYVSPTNTGSSPVLLDSDSDGFADGVEVSAGTDPNDPSSLPGPVEVPSLTAGARLVLLVLVLVLVVVLGLGMRPPRRWRST